MSKLLAIKTKAPEFTLEDKDGTLVSLKKIDSRFTIIFFYPKDNTPGCTIEAKRFSKDLGKFEKLNIAVVGISGGDQKTKTKFCSKHKLKVTLLSDTDFSVAKEYGAYGEKKFMGKKYLGISRVTYLLDENKKIIKVYEKVSPYTHSSEILDYINSINQ